MRKLVQSEYEGDPRFAPPRAACDAKPTRATASPVRAPAPREFRYVEPSRKTRRKRPAGPRSGLAYAAGYAGLAYLFQQSALTFFLSTFGASGVAAVLFVLTWGLCAPLAVLLALLAAVKLDRNQSLRGRLPAVLGFTLGFVGTIDMLVVLTRWLE